MSTLSLFAFSLNAWSDQSDSLYSLPLEELVNVPIVTTASMTEESTSAERGDLAQALRLMSDEFSDLIFLRAALTTGGRSRKKSPERNESS